MRARRGSTAGRRVLLLTLLATGLFAVAGLHPALAQAHNPFGVGISEGGGNAGGITGWILQQQVVFERQLSATIRAARADGSALWLLMGLSFAYGVFHAAGPGHGKAVMASYLFANERALKRGLVLSLLAALLQGLVAMVLVGVLALILHATAQRMKDAASLVESLSYAGIAVLGLWLVWQKGRRFVLALLDHRGTRTAPQGLGAEAARVSRPGVTAMPHLHGPGCTHPSHRLAFGRPIAVGGPALEFQAAGVGAFTEGVAHVHGPDCGHFHAPDPELLGDGFSWREAILTVVAAGSRPCSGAILVLVFALAQGMFLAGLAAVLAMSLGTAITTGALASLAVLAKGIALKMVKPESRRGTLVIRALETAAAGLVLVAGLSLFLGYTSMGGA